MKIFKSGPPCCQRAQRVVIFGSGEEAELAYLAVRALGMKLHGIVDPDRAGKTCLGYEIQDMAWLGEQDGMELMLILQSAKQNCSFEELHEDLRRYCNGAAMLCIEV